MEGGDTLGGIADRFGISVETLLSANGLTLDSLLNIGQVLHIVGSTVPRPDTAGPTLDPYMDSVRSGFTLAVMTFVLVGLTVHYWNTMWMLWGAYIGVRASLYEHFLGTRHISELYSAWYAPPVYVPATERRW